MAPLRRAGQDVAGWKGGDRTSLRQEFFSKSAFFGCVSGSLQLYILHIAVNANKEFGCSGGVSRTRSIAPLSDWEGRQRGAFF